LEIVPWSYWPAIANQDQADRKSRNVARLTVYLSLDDRLIAIKAAAAHRAAGGDFDCSMCLCQRAHKTGQGFETDPVRLYLAGTGVMENPKPAVFDGTSVLCAPSNAGDGLVQAVTSNRKMTGVLGDMSQRSPVMVNDRLNLAFAPTTGQSADLL